MLTKPYIQPLLEFNKGRWIVAKYHSICKCGDHISPGDDLWYIPYNKSNLCSKCGHKLYPKELTEPLKPLPHLPSIRKK